MTMDIPSEGETELDPRAFPLSHVQKGLWFAQQLHPEVPFLVAQYIELRGPVDLGALRWASEQGSFDLESPGIRLVQFDGEPFQLADETIEDELDYVDLRERPDPVGAAHQWIDERRRRPMNVFTDRMIDATLLHLGEDHYFLTTFAHHLTLDGYGAMVLTQRVAELYTHNVARTEVSPTKALQVRALYEAEDAYPASRRFEIDRDYWTERMPDIPAPSRLTEKQAYPSAVSLLISDVLDEALADRLASLARSWDSTAVPVVVAAFAAFLSRMTGNSDIVLSFPVSARTTAAARRSGGSVANVVPLRARVDPHGSVADLVRRVQLELTGALRHQRYRYEDILHDARSSSRESASFGPMVNIMMFHQDIWWGDVLGELNVVATGPVEDLSINLYPGVSGRGIRVDFEGNPAVYDSDELRSHHTRFMLYLDRFVAQAMSATVGSIPMLTERECNALLPSAEHAAVEPETLPDILSETTYLESVAVRDAGGEITYRELHERSNRCARWLIGLGVGPGVRVAVLLPRSIEHVCAVWAVAKTGGAFVPVDPSYPAERIAHMISESGSTIAIALSPDVVPAGVDWIDVADRAETSEPLTDEDRLIPLRVDNAAYVIYTSGSVGAPRGTTITHRGLTGHAAAARRIYLADNDSRVLMSSSPSYDASIHDMLVAATAGAVLVIAPPTVHGGTQLADLIRREQITHWTTTPAVPAAIDSAGMDNLKVMAVAGDVLAPELVSRWGTDRRILNLYGPTEVTIWATGTEVSGADSLISIGRPIEGVSTVVLDRYLQAVPVGVIGELYLSGPGVARGYLDRVGATAARFVADPYSTAPTRMYRTGDLVRWTSEHLLEFVDRADDQVKIRGFRVELGEVNAVLGRYPGVNSAIAVTFSSDGDATIAGYVVGEGLESAKILSFTAQLLPEYMVPSTVTVLNTMPLTPSGKVDRAALPVPARHERELNYWREQLRDMPPAVSLPTDAGPGRRQISESASLTFIVDASLASKLASIAGAHDVILFTVVRAALAVVLATVSADEDFAIGAQLDEGATFPHGRPEGPLALRNRVDHRMTFADFLTEARQTELDAMAHAGVPFETVVSMSGHDRPMERHPLFQVFLAVDGAVPDLPGLDLAVSMTAQGGTLDNGLDGEIVYATRSFDERTIQGWLDRLLELLVIVSRNPRVVIGSIDLLTDAERVAAIGGIEEPTPPPLTLPELFLRRASKSPDDIAVSDCNDAVTYAELAQRSERLAEAMRAVGVRAENVVGVAVSDSVDSVVAHVAVLRLGAGCLPLPPDCATERLRYFIAAAKPDLVLTRLADIASVPLANTGLLVMENAGLHRGSLPGSAVPARPDGVAYVLKPPGDKPIVLTHSNIWSRIQAGAALDVVRAGFWSALIAGERVDMIADGENLDRNTGWFGGIRAYVLDSSLRPVPPGTVGALYIAGRQVGRGYDRLPALTAARFVADPFADAQDAGGPRMYYTGERARYVGDNLESVPPRGPAADLDRWRRALREVGTPAPLAADSSEGGNSSVADSTHEFQISASNHEAAIFLAGQESATLFTVLRTGLSVLVSRLGVHRDIVIGTDVGVGPETNTLALRAKVTSELTFRELLCRAAEFDTAAFENNEVPFGDVADLLGGRRPQVSLTLSPTSDVRHLGAVTADVTFGFAERWSGGDPAGIDAVIYFSPSVFDDATVRSLAELTVGVLKAVVADPDVEVGDIPLIPAEPLSGADAPAVRTFAEILIGTADLFLDSPALTDGDVTLTYRDLNVRSDALARVLIDRGAKPGTVVALGLPRSIDFMIALWAIVKTGAAFLPLDPSHPAERLDRVLTEARVRLGVGQMGPRVGSIEWVPVAREGRSADPVHTVVHPDDVAYVIYTSGSTGTPKGVMVTHRGLSSLTDTAVRRYRTNSSSRVLQGYNPTFDAALLEALLAFGSGGCLVVAPAEVYGGPDLHRVLVDNKVTHYLSTPAVLSSLDVSGLDQIDVVAVGGESLPSELADVWSAGRTMLNAYGPTESTVVATLTEVDTRVTIGGPIPGTTALVLDDRLRAVPVGGIGELYLSGQGLARGYVGAPGRTASRFVALADGALMYRTGDLVHRRADGNLHFISRVDRQVKIRGVRIEPGEIDAVIGRESDVGGVLTVVRPNAVGADVLVSYIVRRGSLDVGALRTRLQNTLPSYLVPGAIVVLERFPLNSSGKIDTESLPAPVFESRPFRAPVTAVEKIVAGVFADVLASAEVGLDDDFFALGGTSLIATQLAARLGNALDTHVPVRLLFEAPTVQALAQRVSSNDIRIERIPLAPRTRPERVPLSLAQRRMWFLSRVDSRTAAYNLPLVVRLTGALNVEALQNAVHALIERHESLRTVFPEHDGEPFQKILPADRVQLDLTPVVVDAGDVNAHLLPVLTRGFDVTASVPIRGTLLKVGANEFVLAIAVHHISGDGFSMAPLARDVMTAYSALSRGELPDWAPLPIQYADYALWQREVLGSEDNPGSLISQQLDYWRATLAGLPDQLDLPSDHPRPPVQSYVGGRSEVVVDADLHAALVDMARATNTTLFMVVHSVLAVLLARLSGTNDIAIGTPLAGRGEAALDDVVGMFVNTMVFRTAIDTADSFDSVLAQNRERDIAGFGHADVPFERLVEVLNPSRSTARHPLFQVGLSFQNLPPLSLELPDLSVAAVQYENQISQFDLHLIVTDEYDGAGTPIGITGYLTYARDLFEAHTAELFVERFLSILRTVVRDRFVPVGDIDIMNPSERRSVLEDWNSTAHLLGPAVNLVEMFDAQVAASPSSVAIVHGDRELTFAEFDSSVNRLARKLIAAGVGPETLVALDIRRSVDLMVGMYAVAKAGGAYVPLDPDQPAERVSYILDTASPVCVLALSRDGSSVSGDRTILYIDTVDLSSFADTPVSDAERLRPLRSTNAAYVIFTSGSTGKPKGVTVTHGAIVNQLTWMRAEYGLSSDEVSLLKTAATFDLSVWEFWGVLAAGGRVVIASASGHRDPTYLIDLMRATSVTTLHAVPSMLDALSASAGRSLPPSVRRVLAIGEALSPATIESFRDVSSAPLFNLYGPTEAAVSVTSHEVTARDTSSVPIGSPEWNTQVYVLDARLHPVVPGVSGELYLAGEQLARGYVARADLTAERFVANPFGAQGERLYRTGDLAAWRENGDLEYLGRTDQQVKLRGFRIELSEVESVLREHAGVARAVCVVRTDVDGGDRLVAYVVPVTFGSIDTESMKAIVADRLPSYMVPGTIVELDALPLSVNGKVDRQALPAPVYLQREFRPPTTDAERVVATVFQDLLGADRVGIDDNFFELGGNSLMAVRVLSRIEAATGSSVPLQALMADPTPGSIAGRMGGQDTDDNVALQVIFPIRSGGDGRPVFCIHPIVGLAWCYTGLALYIDSGRRIYGIQSPGILDDTQQPESIDQLASRYVDEVRRIQPAGPYDLLGWSLGGVLAHAMAIQLQASGEVVDSVVMLDSYPHPPVSGEDELAVDVADLLASVGYEGEVPEEIADISAASATTLLHEMGGPLTGLTPEHLVRMMSSAAYNRNLLETYRPGVLQGDVLFFSAAQDDEIREQTYTSWEPYVDGMIRHRAVDTTHWHMTAPKALETVGEGMRRAGLGGP